MPNSDLTLQWTEQLAVAVSLSGDASEPRVEIVASLNETLARRDLAAERGALRAFGVVVHGVWAVAREIRNRRHLGLGFRDTIGEDD